MCVNSTGNPGRWFWCKCISLTSAIHLLFITSLTLLFISALFRQWILVGLEALVLIPYMLAACNRQSVRNRRVLFIAQLMTTMLLVLYWTFVVVQVVYFIDFQSYCVENSFGEYSIAQRGEESIFFFESLNACVAYIRQHSTSESLVKARIVFSLVGLTQFVLHAIFLAPLYHGMEEQRQIQVGNCRGLSSG